MKTTIRDRKSIFKQYFNVLIIGLTFIMGALLWEYYQLRMRELIRSGQIRQESILKIQKKTFSASMKTMFVDLWEISNRTVFPMYISNPTDENLAVIKDVFFRYLKSKPYYNQIRLIDTNGYEKVRVTINDKGNVIITPNNELQDKRDRYYFKNALELEKDQLYISHFDLNFENNAIEIPYNPTIRFSTLIRDKKGEVKFVLVLNLSADAILNEVTEDRNILTGKENIKATQFIINQDGYYLKHPDKNKMWGFILPERKKHNFFTNNPKIKDQISSKKEGVVLTDEGIYNYIEINPEDVIEKIKHDFEYKIQLSRFLDIKKAQKYYIINHINPGNHSISNSELYRKIILLFIILFIFFLVISYFAATSISNRIYNDNLIKQSENNLRKANVAKGKFIKILAHDLKNPITSIQAFSEILASDDDDFSNAQRKNFSKLIRNSTQVMLQLIDDVLNWSKAQSGDLKIQKENIELDDVVYYALSLLRIQAEKKEVVLNTELEEHVQVYADPNMLVTIIRNLVSNAVKFSHRESSIDIRVFEEIDEIILEVQDYGLGIPEEKISILFDAGEKNYSKGTENESGTGLGLVLCKEFLDKNDGKIEVTSELNKGTTFTLRFPKVEQ